jgi:proteasome lid subunit RPN8/RPN11
VNLTFAPGVLEDILAHARECAPQECCGLIAGRHGSGRRVIRMQNALDSHTAYAMDPAELVSALRSLRDSGEELAAIYHSHPRGPAEPSARDIREAHYPEAAYVIVSLEPAETPVTRAFRIIEGRAYEVELRAIV